MIGLLVVIFRQHSILDHWISILEISGYEVTLKILFSGPISSLAELKARITQHIHKVILETFRTVVGHMLFIGFN